MQRTITNLLISLVIAAVAFTCQWAVAAESEAPLGAWSGDRAQPATPSEPSSGDKVQPPVQSFGFQGCRQYGIWVFLYNGKSYRYDSEHNQIKTAEEMKKLLAWLNTGPSDIVTIQCLTGVSA